MQHPAAWLVIAVAGVIVGWVIAVYNRLVSLRVRARNAWADVDVQLKRRYDLVPNLIAVVQGYASHEKALLEDVARLRSEAVAAKGPADREGPEGQLTGALRSLFAIAEAYPELRADTSFRKLQEQLADIEDNLQYARRYYNAVVRDMNTATEVFPQNIVAAVFGFRRLPYFQVGDEERRAVEVDLG
ncbi:MAG: LemA family protein [Armatimonadota bacterium]|nr:MAG: LemA family protein [Armatimonadota bacterium]